MPGQLLQEILCFTPAHLPNRRLYCDLSSSCEVLFYCLSFHIDPLGIGSVCLRPGNSAALTLLLSIVYDLLMGLSTPKMRSGRTCRPLYLFNY